MNLRDTKVEINSTKILDIWKMFFENIREIWEKYEGYSLFSTFLKYFIDNTNTIRTGVGRSKILFIQMYFC